MYKCIRQDTITIDGICMEIEEGKYYPERIYVVKPEIFDSKKKTLLIDDSSKTKLMNEILKQEETIKHV